MRTPILIIFAIYALWAPAASAQTDDLTCAHIQLLSSIDRLSDPTTMSIKGGRAYIIEDQSSLAIIDISNPDQLVLLGRTADPLPAVDAITLNGDAAYLRRADGQGFEIIDISNDAQPGHAGSFQLSISSSPLVIHEDYMYASNQYILNVSQPFNPVIELDNPDYADDWFVLIHEGIAYTDRRDRYDLSDPLNPMSIDFFCCHHRYDRLKSSPPYLIGINADQYCSIFSPDYEEFPLIYSSELPGIVDVAIREKIGFVAADQLDVYLLSQDARLVSSFSGQPGLDSPIQIEQIGDTTLILNAEGELAAYTIETNPIVSLQTRGHARQVKLRDHLAFVLGDLDYGTGIASLTLFDVADPSHPVRISEVPYGIGEGFDLHENHAYIAHRGNGLAIAEIDDNLQIQHIRFFETDPKESIRIYDVVIHDAIAYLVDGYTGLHILDLEDPVNPTPISVAAIDGPPYGLAKDGDLVFVSSFDYLSIFDVSDPISPVLLSRILAQPDRIVGMQRATRNGNLLYLPEVWDGYRVFDISDAANPVELAQIDTNITTDNGDFIGLTYQITIDGDTLYAANSSGGLSIYDNTDLTNPVLLRHIAGPIQQGGSEVTFRDIELRDNRVYIAAGDGGLRIYDLDDCAAPCPADFNDDGRITFFDISFFLTAYNNQDPAADLTGDGRINFFDISLLFEYFHSGCP